MKNNLYKIFLVILVGMLGLLPSLSDEFNFKVSEVQISNDGNIYKGINGGSITTQDNLKIISDTFEYNKLTNVLEAYGNVKIIDPVKNIILHANKVFYFKNDEKIFTDGETKIFIENKYKINSTDLILFRNSMLLSSSKKTTMTDKINNFYEIKKNFIYSINKEQLSGNFIKIIMQNKDEMKDNYFFEKGFFNLKDKKFLAKDVKINFDKMTFDNSDNDPRVRAITATGDKFNTYLNKAVFTSCKNDDKCPPWILSANKVTHDKIKKQIIYKKAWLKIYDTPIMYFPKFFHPDPSVERQSGFLKPNISNMKTLGRSIFTPYFLVISDHQDLTIKPKIYSDGKFVFQNEYRHKTKNSSTVADFSITTGHSSIKGDKKNNKTHFFTKTEIDLNFSEFIESTLNIQYQKTSNDTYLKLFNLESPWPLIPLNTRSLESGLKLDLTHDEYDFNAEVQSFETLSVRNSDRYQYVLPSYNFAKNFNLMDFRGSFNINSYGNNTLASTNILTSSISNDLNYNSFNKSFDNGVRSNYGIYIKNLNSLGKNHSTYKSSPQVELMSSYIINASYPLIRRTKKTTNIFNPKMSLRFSPHDMKNNKDIKRRINIDNIYNSNRLGIDNSFEAGESLTLGFDFKKEKLKKKKISDQVKKLNIQEMEKYFTFKLATVLRNKVEKNIPYNSTLGRKSSNVFGKIDYKVSDNINIDYNFSIDNDLSTFNYNSINTKINFNNFETSFKFLEENKIIGSSNILENISTYEVNESNNIKFKTRRNRKINLTEYYNLIYEYKNDCLVAGLTYKKNFYQDTDIKPSEELFFSITIIPLTKFSPGKITK